MGEDRDRPACAGRDRVGKPAFVSRQARDYGEAREDNMNEEKEPKPKGLTRREFLKAGAVVAGAAAGLVLPDSPERAGAEAPKYKVFIPQVNKEYKENPYLTREFGAPERGVIMRNKVEQGGGNPAYVEMGDQELFNNMLYLREQYGRPDLKLEITFYSSKNLLLRDPQAPRWIQENYRGVLNYDSWAGGNGTFHNGSILFKYDEEQKTLRFYTTLPETFKGMIPTNQELNRIHTFFLSSIRGKFLAHEDGRSHVEDTPQTAEDFRNHPVWVPNIENWPEVSQSAFWVKLETVPTTGGK